MRVLALTALAALLASAAAAEESPAAWLARILDPRTVGVEPFPEATLNRKLSVDTIRLARDPGRRIAVYLAPLDRVTAASAHFAQQLGVAPKVTGKGSEFETHELVLRGGGKYPPQAEGLRIQITRSPWVTGNLQITMELPVAASAP